MTDHTILFTLNKASDSAGYDFCVIAEGGPSIPIAKNIPDVRAALAAIVDAFTAPLVDKDRLDLIDEQVAAISGLLDRVTELEGRVEATRLQAEETNKALIRLLAGGSGLPAQVGHLGSHKSNLAPTTYGPPDNLLEAPRIVEEGFAGTFRRPLTDYVHAGPGQFPGGAFRPGGSQVVGPPPLPQQGQERIGEEDE